MVHESNQSKMNSFFNVGSIAEGEVVVAIFDFQTLLFVYPTLF
jgi:hypothetical protein